MQPTTTTATSPRARALVFDKFQPRNAGELVSWRARALPVAIDVTAMLATDQVSEE